MCDCGICFGVIPSAETVLSLHGSPGVGVLLSVNRAESMSALRLTYPVAKEDGLHVEIPPFIGLVRVEDARRADWLCIREEVAALSLVKAGVSAN